jgi:hypothetical protein
VGPKGSPTGEGDGARLLNSPASIYRASRNYTQLGSAMDRHLSTDILTSILSFLSRNDLDSLPLVNYRLHALLLPYKNAPFRQRRVLEAVSLNSYHEYRHVNPSPTPLMRSGHWQIVVRRALSDSHPRALVGCKLVCLADGCYSYLVNWSQLILLIDSCPYALGRLILHCPESIYTLAHSLRWANYGREGRCA